MAAKVFFRVAVGKTLLLTTLWMAGGGAQACGPGGSGSTCGTASEPASPSTSSVNVGAGNPINVITGNKYQREVDMPALPGVLGLEVVRHYNSMLSGANTAPGIVGRGWKLSYETQLFAFDSTLQIMQADGTRLIFSRDLLDPSLCASADPANGKVAITGARGKEQYAWTLNDGRRLTFDARGKLVQIKAPTGEAVTLLYDPQGLLVKVTDPQGRELRLAYLDREAGARGDRFRGVQSIVTPVGRFSYEYGSALPAGAKMDKVYVAANLVAVRYPATAGADAGGATGRTYHYENASRPTYLTGISVAGKGGDGKVATHRYATYGYDMNGKAVLSTHGGNADKVTLDYSVGGQTTVANSLGQKTIYRHAIVAGEYRLLEARGPGCSLCGETDLRYGYDARGRLTEMTKLDRQGKPLQGARFELDLYGRMLVASRIGYANGKPQAPQWLVRYEYGDSLASNPTLIARPSVVAGRETSVQIAYNSAGQPLHVTQSGWAPPLPGAVTQAIHLERTTSYAYRTVNGRSVLAEIDGPLPNGPKASPADSDITRFSWSEGGGAVTGITWPGQFSSALAYDAAGRIERVTDDQQNSTKFLYDARGRIVATTANGITQRSSFDALGRPIESGYQHGDTYKAYERYGYDDTAQRAWRATALGMLDWRQYDTEGRLRESGTRTASMAITARAEYDAYGQAIRAEDSTGASRVLQWNGLGLPEQVTDALGRKTAYQYDDSGRVRLAVNSSGATRVERDVHGRVTAVVAPNGATTRYAVDDFGRITAMSSPDSGEATRSHDEADRVVASADALGNKGRYAYDVAGRVIEQVVETAAVHGAAAQREVTRWTYQGRQLIALQHPEQSERYEYDERHRLLARFTSLRKDDGAKLHSVTRYRYDAAGQLTGMVMPDGSELVYRRNGQNQVVALVRERVQTTWLRWMLPGEVLVRDIKRSLAGLKHYTFGNGIRADHRRSAQGVLTSIAYQTPAGGTVLDHAYRWDAAGNLLASTGQGGGAGFAYDARDRLIAASMVANGKAQHARYHYDAAGNRVLAQEGVPTQSDLYSNTLRAAYAPASNRWLGYDGQQVRLDDAGQPRQVAGLRYTWDAQGRLLAAANGNATLAAYRYNANSERTAKTAQGRSIYYLYEDGKLAAELDGNGRITRQYVYLGDVVAAVIDAQVPSLPADSTSSAIGQAMRDIAVIVRGWLSAGERTVFVLTNHLGASEAVTDSQGMVVWRMDYLPFGGELAAGAVVRTGLKSAAGFVFNLRLPGQYFDAETGLHYNHHRYYDPRLGRYLSPDPLGLGGGINLYAYVSNNPLKYIDPEGLILFAFDGTGNDRSDPATLSNVVRFFELYNDGKGYYITGPATRDPDSGIVNPWYAGGALGDTVKSLTGKKRIAQMVEYFNTHAEGMDDETVMDVDITGFSRGASQARDFANQIVAKMKNGYYSYKNKEGKEMCQKVNFRFMGIFDTVLSEHTGSYQLGIPDAFSYVAHAIALNEYRGNAVEFPLESIQGAPVPAGTTRIERGFLGAHSDIGGGYPDQELAKVALDWMISQARSAGVAMYNGATHIEANPVMHDASTNLMYSTVGGGPSPGSEDRDVRFRDGTVVKQRAYDKGNMKYDDTVGFISYVPNPVRDAISARVDAKAYINWLNAHGYGIKLAVQ